MIIPKGLIKKQSARLILPTDDFLRVSRSAILRLDRIEGIRWNWQQGTQLSFRGSQDTLTIGRSATRRLKDRLEA